MCSLNATTPQLKAVKNFIDGYCSFDVKNIEPHMSKDFMYQSFPAVPGLPVGSKEQHFDSYKPVLSLMTKLEFTFHEVIEAPGKAMTLLSAMIHMVRDTKLDYDALVVFTLAEEGGGLKVAHLKDFPDPEKRNKLYGWVAKTLGDSGVPVA